MLDHIPQKGEKDCVIATAAIVANVNYEYAAVHSPVPVGERGLRLTENLHLLESLTGTRWRVSNGWWRPVWKIAAFEQICVIITHKPWHWRTLHCLAFEGPWVHDSAFPHSFSRDEYPWKQWRTRLVLRPINPELLAEVRRKNLWAKFRADMGASGTYR